MDQSSFSPANLAVARLSQRQIECLSLAGEGHTSKEIARAICISPSTVDNHIRLAIERLSAKNRMDAIRILRDSTPDPNAENGGLPTDYITPSERESRVVSAHLPPLGGVENNLPASRRVAHILRVAVLSVMASGAAILTIMGTVHVLH